MALRRHRELTRRLRVAPGTATFSGRLLHRNDPPMTADGLTVDGFGTRRLPSRRVPTTTDGVLSMSFSPRSSVTRCPPMPSLLASPYVLPILLLIGSNVFMTFAWY